MKREKVKVAVIGCGNRGRLGLLRTLLVCPEAEIVALCDLREDRLQKAKEDVAKAGRTVVPELYTDYNELLKNDNVEAVVIASSWDEHTRMSVAAMKAGKITACEVGGAYDVEDCWQLVRTYEETKTPIMLLENCCYGKFELLCNSLARSKKFGKVLYCHGAYAHELRDEILGGNVRGQYRLRNYMLRNCENYPTHELGPIAKLLDINRGNKMLSLTAVATKGGVGLEEFSKDKRSPDPSLAGTKFAQADIVLTTITCAGGEVITLRLDTTLPRTYSREFTVRGTEGFALEDSNLVLLEADGNMHAQFNSSANSKANMDTANNYEQYLPSIWRKVSKDQESLGHGGMDYLVVKAFLNAILNDEEMPIDVYDMAAWMVITPLSEQSIAHGGMPQAIPDFTRGKWMLRQPKDVVPLPKVEEENEEVKNAFGHSRV